MTLTIYGSPRSRTMSVLWAAAGLGLDCQHVPLAWDDPAFKSSEFLRLRPAGAVPVVDDDDGFALAESMAIILYLAKEHGAAGRYPATPEGEAEAWRWSLWTVGGRWVISCRVERQSAWTPPIHGRLGPLNRARSPQGLECRARLERDGYCVLVGIVLTPLLDAALDGGAPPRQSMRCEADRLGPSGGLANPLMHIHNEPVLAVAPFRRAVEAI